VDGQVAVDYEITPEELKALLDGSSDVVVLDVREPWEIATASMGHTKHIPMNDIPAKFGELDIDKHTVVVCHHGVRSMRVTMWLRQQGYEKVQSLAGGIDRWAREVDTRVPTY
jgi:rhodanese-related sulfurtransferase